MFMAPLFGLELNQIASKSSLCVWPTIPQKEKVFLQHCIWSQLNRSIERFKQVHSSLNQQNAKKVLKENWSKTKVRKNIRNLNKKQALI